MTWLTDERARLAADRILDATGALIAVRGVRRVQMGDIARAAGCSRATVYRYYRDRESLLLAYVQREAARVGAAVAAEVRDLDRDADLVTEAVLASVRLVRASPALAMWFTADDGGLAATLAHGSDVVRAMGLGVVDDPEDAEWLVRVIVSLLITPGADAEAERRMVERYVRPVLVGPRV